MKRVVKLWDEAPSGDVDANVISLTLWGAMATNVGARIEELLKAGEPPIIVVKDAKLGEFMGRFISSVSMTQVHLNPDDALRPCFPKSPR